MKCPHCNIVSIMTDISRELNICRICRQKRIPEYIPLSQHIKYFKELLKREEYL